MPDSGQDHTTDSNNSFLVTTARFDSLIVKVTYGDGTFRSYQYDSAHHMTSWSENIEKTIVWIKYPCLEIPGEPEMTENASRGDNL